MNQHTSSQLSSIISTLGGPSIQAEDIEWAIDLPAGKKLVDWLAAQFLDETDTSDMTRRVSLRNIALEAAEAELCVTVPWNNGTSFDSSKV
jgi:hypothetical protein